MFWAIYVLMFGLCVSGTQHEKIVAKSANDPLDKLQRHLPDVELDWNTQHDIETTKLRISGPVGHALVSTLDKNFDLRPLRTNAFRFLGEQKKAKEYILKIEHACPELSDSESNHVSRVPDGYFVVRKARKRHHHYVRFAGEPRTDRKVVYFDNHRRRCDLRHS